MQVEKQHYLIKLLLPIFIYLSFATPEGKNLRLIIVVILNTLLFQGIYYNSKSIKSLIVSGTIFEILSSNVIGIFIVKYLLFSKVITFCKSNFQNLKVHTIFIVSTFTFVFTISLEVMVKEFLQFNLDYLWYEIVGVFTVISIVATSYIAKTSLYRHLK